MTVTIYHNPACGTSRNTLEMIRQSGEEPEVIEYLKTPPSRERLADLLARMGLRPRDILREKGTPYAELGLGDPALSDDALLDAMMAHPILINRPIVVTTKGVALCRPSEKVLSLLENPVATFTKEDGEQVNASAIRLKGEVVKPNAELVELLQAADLPVADLHEPGRIFMRFLDENGALAGYGGYEPLGNVVLLRSVVVPVPNRGTGLGGAIARRLMRHATEGGATARSWPRSAPASSLRCSHRS
jgi:arsenate reductase